MQMVGVPSGSPYSWYPKDRPSGSLIALPTVVGAGPRICQPVEYCLHA